MEDLYICIYINKYIPFRTRNGTLESCISQVSNHNINCGPVGPQG